MRERPKKSFTKINGNRKITGDTLRISHQQNVLEKSPIFPKPLEYEDIDDAVFEFVDKKLEMVIDGKVIPTFTLYSNQRFSEYSQMWEHSDEFGNLYMNFKAVNRKKDPGMGKNQGDLWNIPGERKYTLLQREILDDSGIECYEIYTMKQPYAVDMTYTVNFITTMVEHINDFNQKLNKLFSARQCYIKPNGYFVPMVIDEIADETSYSISDRKFFIQSVTIKLMAYIIEEKDFEVKKYPKRVNISAKGDKFMKNKPCVDLEETENEYGNKELKVNLTFKPYNSKASFEFDTEMKVEKIYMENVRNLRVMVNDELYYIEKGFTLKENDSVKIVVKPIRETEESFVQFIGYEVGTEYKIGYTPEKVYDEPVTSEEIIVE